MAATAFVSAGLKFSLFYGISLGLALVNLGVVLSAFRFSYRVDDAVVPTIELTTTGTEGPEGEEHERDIGTQGGERSLFSQTFSSQTVWTFALFIFL